MEASGNLGESPFSGAMRAQANLVELKSKRK